MAQRKGNGLETKEMNRTGACFQLSSYVRQSGSKFCILWFLFPWPQILSWGNTWPRSFLQSAILPSFGTFFILVLLVLAVMSTPALLWMLTLVNESQLWLSLSWEIRGEVSEQLDLSWSSSVFPLRTFELVMGQTFCKGYQETAAYTVQPAPITTMTDRKRVYPKILLCRAMIVYLNLHFIKFYLDWNTTIIATTGDSYVHHQSKGLCLVRFLLNVCEHKTPARLVCDIRH